jgi:hypothetical protein
MTSYCTNVREKWLKLITDAREIGVDQFWLDVVTHVHGKETEGIRSQINGKLMSMAEGEVNTTG